MVKLSVCLLVSNACTGSNPTRGQLFFQLFFSLPVMLEGSLHTYIHTYIHIHVHTYIHVHVSCHCNIINEFEFVWDVCKLVAFNIAPNHQIYRTIAKNLMGDAPYVEPRLGDDYMYMPQVTLRYTLVRGVCNLRFPACNTCVSTFLTYLI